MGPWGGHGSWEGPSLPCAGTRGSSAAPASPSFFARSRRGLASGSSVGSCRFFFPFCPRGRCCRGNAGPNSPFPFARQPPLPQHRLPLRNTAGLFPGPGRGWGDRGPAPGTGTRSHLQTSPKGATYHGAAPPGKAEGRKEKRLLADRRDSVSAGTDSHVPAPGDKGRDAGAAPTPWTMPARRDKPTLCCGDPSQEPPRAPVHLSVGVPGDLSWARGHGDGQAARLRTSISSRPCKRLPSKPRSRDGGQQERGD